jgi:hypothetical protein
MLTSKKLAYIILKMNELQIALENFRPVQHLVFVALEYKSE